LKKVVAIPMDPIEKNRQNEKWKIDKICDFPKMPRRTKSGQERRTRRQARGEMAGPTGFVRRRKWEEEDLAWMGHTRERLTPHRFLAACLRRLFLSALFLSPI
jgi:hypothetical protein